MSENPYQCAVCNERFSKKSALEKHYFSHAKLTFGVKKCYDCGRFCMKDSEHCKVKKRKLIRCKECRICFASKAEFVEHNASMHKLKHACEFCDKSFTTIRGLLFHARIHVSIKPHICHVCDKAFTWKSILQDHLLTHSNIKAFACEFCNRQFRTKKILKKHYLTHTKEKPYMCEICYRCFSAKGSLKRHYDTHNKIKKESVIL